MDFWIRAAQLLLSLSILIVLHEFGHFLPAKLFKIRVEKFYLFFDPYFSLLKKKIGDTEYGIGWLPLGGYVKISGMIDESMDKEQMEKPAEDWEFRSKPAWQRLIVMVGGVTVNILLGFIIYAMVLFTWGDKFLPNDSLTDGVWCTDSLANEIGFQTGDKIVSIGGETVVNFEDILPEMLNGGEVVVNRNGRQEAFEIPQNFIETIIDDNSKARMFFPRIPFYIGSVPEESQNKHSGLQKQDKIVTIAGTPIAYFDEAKAVLEQHKNTDINITVERKLENESISMIDIPVHVSKEGRIDVFRANIGFKELQKLDVYKFDIREYGFFESFPAGVVKTGEKLSFYMNQMSIILTPSTGAYKGVGGFGSIGKMFPPEWNWEMFWRNTAFISIILAFMNILPIPALDGGHVVFLLWEMITGKTPPQKLMEYAQGVGMILLLALLVFANGNDIFRALTGK